MIAFALLLFAASEDALMRWMVPVAQKQLAARSAGILKIQTTQAAEARKAEVRTKILELLGGLPDLRGPLNAKISGSLDRGTFVIENLSFESLPGLIVTANLYRPKDAGRHPAILIPMGHWEEGKAAAQRIASNFAVKGFVALVYDPVGQGERQQAFDPRLGKSLLGGSTEQHFANGAQALLLGQSFARYRIWDGIRALDYLVSRPEVDAERIGCTGCSGGGTLTTYISALDPRVKVAAPSCYMNSFRTLFTGPVGDSEQSLPNFLSSGLDQTDYVEMFAPKPWLITSTEADFFTPAGAKQVYEEAREWYGLYGAADRLKWVVGPGGHGMPLVVREAIYEWMIRWLQSGKGNPQEVKIDLVPDHMLRVTEGGQVSGRELYQIIRETPLQRGSLTELKAFVTELLQRNPAFGAKIDAPALGTERRPAVILIDRSEEEAARLRLEGKVVIVVHPARAASRNYSGNWLANTRAWLIGHNLPAMHAAEIRRAVDLAVTRSDVDPKHISAHAGGIAGIWLLLAASADPRITEVELDRTPHSYRAALDGPVHRNLHDAVIPGFALRWDLPDLVRLIEPRKVVWKNPSDWMNNIVLVDGKYSYTSSDPSR